MDAGKRRIAESASMMLIGEGVLALWRPEAHCRLWRGDAGPWSRLVDWFVDRPNVVRGGGCRSGHRLLARIPPGTWAGQICEVTGEPGNCRAARTPPRPVVPKPRRQRHDVSNEISSDPRICVVRTD